MNTLTLIFAFALIAIVTVNGIPLKDSRIAGGAIANPGQFNYAAALQTPALVQFCVASIISNRWLITAAHCTYGRVVTNINARVGTTIFNKGGVLHQIAQVQANPLYVHQTRANDLSLLQTVLPIVFDWQTNAIALSAFDQGVTSAVVAGWGSLFNGGPQSLTLQFINTQTLLNPDCLVQHAATGLAGLIQESNVCAFASFAIGICTGDSGSALAVGNQLLGVASWSNGCATGTPDVFTRISAHRDWIMATAV